MNSCIKGIVVADMTKKQLAEHAYKQFVSVGWTYSDLIKLQDTVIKSYLVSIKRDDVKAPAIRQLVQNINNTHNKDLAKKQIVNSQVPAMFASVINVTNAGQWQHYDPYTETYETQPEEETNMKTTNEITITVPMTPYAETTTTTMFGMPVDENSELCLVDLIKRINEKQYALKDLNKSAKSSRITKQIAKLETARNKATEMLDNLPDE